MTPDAINATFELAGGIFVGFSIWKLHKEQLVRGVSWIHVCFCFMWGGWNLFYYPYLGQWLSFLGGLLIVATNLIWFIQLIYYTHMERLGKGHG